MSAAVPGARAQPYYCPYCGETDIRPTAEQGGWYCTICDRRWRLSFDGLGPPADADPESESEEI